MGTSGSIETSTKILVLFDGVCNLCNGAVQFIIKRDPASNFIFASLQSDFGISQLVKFKLDPVSLHSIVVIDKGTVFQRSDAVLKIASGLHGSWAILSGFKFFPRLIRDGLYDLIASHRYRIFGKNDSCMTPTQSIKARFIE